ncbi:DUF6777 domain-containing protein [Geodermatophilus sp. SYSU D00696]
MRHRETLLPLQTFGPYELDELLGHGRSGEVHRAWDTRRHRTVALRILRPELTQDPRFRVRFLRDCERAARVDEPHVVRVHEFGEIDGRLYVDTELVDGRTLAAALAADGPLPASRAVVAVSQLASALDAAHARGLVHRDVRPSEVLLSGPSTRPVCHLSGFGVAGAPVAGTGQDTTADGVGPVEVPRYVPPERLTARLADHRVDVYALACLLYEVLTGRPPFDAADPQELYAAHLHREPPRPSDAVESLPPALDDVVAHGMAKDPDRRYGTAGELAQAARAALVPAPDTVPVKAVAPPAAGGARGAAAGGARGAAAGGARGAATGPAGARRARHRVPPPAPRAGHRRGLIAVLVAGAVAVSAAGGVAAVRLASDSSDAAASTPVVAEPAGDPGDDPFVPPPPGTADPAQQDGAPGPGSPGTAQPDDEPAPGSAGSSQPDGEAAPDSAGTPQPDGDGPAEGTAGTTSGAGGPASGAAAPATAAGSTVAGNRPGLYGGSGAEVCDPAAMAEYLDAHPDAAAAFAAVEDVPRAEIGDYLAALTPVVLRFDTAVTNHGLAHGRAIPFQSVLQAGTAVLVDGAGVPQVRCICGNPLAPPAPRPGPEYGGDPWPGLAPETVVVVQRSPAPVPVLVLVDDATGAVEARPAGTAGDADRPVAPQLAAQARGFAPTPPSSSAPPSADPQAAGTTGTGPGATGSPSAGGSAGTGGSPPAGDPPGTSDPATGGTPAPAPGGPEEPGSPPADDGTAGEAPGDEAPPAGPPPADEPPPPAEAPPAEPPAGEPPPADDAPPAGPPPADEPPPAEEPPPVGPPPADQPPVEAPPAEAPPPDPEPAEEPAEAPAETPAETPAAEAPADEPAGRAPAEEAREEDPATEVPADPLPPADPVTP